MGVEGDLHLEFSKKMKFPKNWTLKAEEDKFILNDGAMLNMEQQTEKYGLENFLRFWLLQPATNVSDSDAEKAQGAVVYEEVKVTDYLITSILDKDIYF
mmetsp:Transcript_5879/g.9514  ORF Transcript_5879/g.9514 Transcript_5879/m.9514 type:complete len:99 (-) Transcript_5879:3598-3894(-)